LNKLITFIRDIKADMCIVKVM